MRFVIPLLVAIFVASGGLYVGNQIFTKGDNGTSLLSTTTPISMPPAPAPMGEFVPSSGEIAGETIPPPPSNPGSTDGYVAICSGTNANNFDCYEQYYAGIIKTKGIKNAFDDLKIRYTRDGFVKAQCHPLTHVIGRFAAKEFATVGEAYTEGDGFCWSGYYHGVLETFIDDIGLANLPVQMDSVCANITGKERYSFDYYNCVHGLGHGVMAATQTELFQSLDLCDNLSGAWEEVSCASGAFMENIIVDGLNHKTKYLDPARPLYPCTDSPEKYKSTCYLMQTSYMLKINGGDFKKTFEWCRDAAGHESICWQSLGRDASGRSSSDAARTKVACFLGENFEERSNCVIGAVKDFISYFHSDVQAKSFCGSLDDEDLTSVCLAVGETYYRQF